MSENYWYRKAITRRRFTTSIGVGSMGAAAAAIVGCGDDDDDATSPSTTAAGASSTAAGASSTAAGTKTAAATQVRTDKSVRIGISTEPVTVDPHDSTGGTTDVYNFQLWSPLIGYNLKGTDIQAALGLSRGLHVIPMMYEHNYEIALHAQSRYGDRIRPVIDLGHRVADALPAAALRRPDVIAYRELLAAPYQLEV